METNKIVVVTGANRGLGLETSRALAERGFHVVMVGRNPEEIGAAAQVLAEKGLSVEAFSADVARESDMVELASHVKRRHGRLDVLVNNAGIFPDPSETARAGVLSVPIEIVAKAFDTNTLGALRACQQLVPLMVTSGGGNIVNVSSGMGGLQEMNGFFPGYRLSKTALNALTRVLHHELNGQGVNVNSVCPGWVRTDMGGPNANRSLEEGASGIVWAATLPRSGPSGGFFRDGKPLNW